MFIGFRTKPDTIEDGDATARIDGEVGNVEGVASMPKDGVTQTTGDIASSFTDCLKDQASAAQEHDAGEQEDGSTHGEILAFTAFHT